MTSAHSQWWKRGSLMTLLVALTAAPGLTQSANFGKFTVGSGKPVVVTGSTGGSTSLPAIITNTDRNGNKCLGFGDPKPDHVMELTKPLATLTFKVNNGNTDNTLLVVGPKDVVRCGDAVLEDSGWEAGIYQVWVGSGTPASRKDYRLTVRGK
jgi:hypothetical protein